MTEKRNNETLAEFNERKANELITARARHVANAHAWVTLATVGPVEYETARLEMVEHELKLAGLL